MRLTRQTLAVLRMFAAEHPTELYGRQIMQACRLKSGTLYPILDRLERAWWIEGEWDVPAVTRGPRRRYYRLRAEGVARLAALDIRDTA